MTPTVILGGVLVICAWRMYCNRTLRVLVYGLPARGRSTYDRRAATKRLIEEAYNELGKEGVQAVFMWPDGSKTKIGAN